MHCVSVYKDTEKKECTSSSCSTEETSKGYKWDTIFSWKYLCKIYYSCSPPNMWMKSTLHKISFHVTYINAAQSGWQYLFTLPIYIIYRIVSICSSHIKEIIKIKWTINITVYQNIFYEVEITNLNNYYYV